MSTDQTKPVLNPVSSTLMDEILTELRLTLPKGIEYVGKRKTDSIVFFEFKADDGTTCINYNEHTGTFIPVASNNLNDYNWNVSLKDLIFNKDGYLLALQDYLISTMNLVTQKHYGYSVKGFRFGGARIWLMYNFDCGPDIEVEVVTDDRMEEVTDNAQKDAIVALKRLFEASLVKSPKLVPDTSAYIKNASPLLSQQISHELSKKTCNISDMPTLYFCSKYPNPAFKPKMAIAHTINDFSNNINRVLKIKMATYMV